jgi:hypothetical protein
MSRAVRPRGIGGRFISNPLAGFLADMSSEMQWTPVASSNVAEVGYNAGTNTLGVRFNNGSEYNYFDVDEDVYTSFLSASSKGKFVYYTLRGGYAYERVA